MSATAERFGRIAKGDKSLSLSAIILTRNEEVHIERAVGAIATLARHVFVVDSFSTDRTVELARAAGAQVVQREFVNYAQQFQWALDNLPIETDWVFRLDADELCSPELVAEIARRLPSLPDDVTGIVLRLNYVFLGRRIRHGGRDLKLLRIMRKGAARIEQRWMDEHIVLLRGRTVTLDNYMFDHNLKDVSFFIEKHNGYATRESIDAINAKQALFLSYDSVGDGGSPLPMSSKRWIKEKIYNHLPLWFGPLSYFTLRYVVLLGFLDGREGLIYHFLQGYWYRFLVGSRVYEFELHLRNLPEKQARVEELARLTGFSFATPGAGADAGVPIGRHSS